MKDITPALIQVGDALYFASEEISFPFTVTEALERPRNFPALHNINGTLPDRAPSNGQGTVSQTCIRIMANTTDSRQFTVVVDYVYYGSQKYRGETYVGNWTESISGQLHTQDN